MSPVIDCQPLLFLISWDQFTLTILVSLLDDGIVDVGMNLELFQRPLHTCHALLFLALVLRVDLLLLETSYARSLSVHAGNLLFSVGD